MTNLKETKYTLVQHSGFGYGHKPGFAHAVETRSLSTVGEVSKVQRAGGMIFDSYKEADDAEDKVNGVTGGDFLAAKGSFSEQTIDGLRIYQPPKVIA